MHFKKNIHSFMVIVHNLLILHTLYSEICKYVRQKDMWTIKSHFNFKKAFSNFLVLKLNRWTSPHNIHGFKEFLVMFSFLLYNLFKCSFTCWGTSLSLISNSWSVRWFAVILSRGGVDWGNTNFILNNVKNQFKYMTKHFYKIFMENVDLGAP